MARFDWPRAFSFGRNARFWNLLLAGSVYKAVYHGGSCDPPSPVTLSCTASKLIPPSTVQEISEPDQIKFSIFFMVAKYDLNCSVPWHHRWDEVVLLTSTHGFWHASIGWRQVCICDVRILFWYLKRRCWLSDRSMGTLVISLGDSRRTQNKGSQCRVPAFAVEIL